MCRARSTLERGLPLKETLTEMGGMRADAVSTLQRRDVQGPVYVQGTSVSGCHVVRSRSPHRTSIARGRRTVIGALYGAVLREQFNMQA